jgi:hypothetical protein
MQLEALPMQFVALTDGILNGEEHVLLFVESTAQHRPCGLALTLADAGALLVALRTLLPEARQIQNRLNERN